MAVLVSGRGTNLAALLEAQRRGSLGGFVCLVLADRECPAIDLARGGGLETAVVLPDDHASRTTWDIAVRDRLMKSGAELVVLAGFMRILGAPVLGSFPGRLLNVHPSLLPAFPGRDAIADALAAGVAITGVTVHFVDETVDGGPILLQEASPIHPDDDQESLAARLHTVEHRLLPRAVALTLGGAVRLERGRATIDAVVAAKLRPARRALLSVSDKRGLAALGRALDELGFQLVSTGGTASALRAAGLTVIDVASITGFPEMLGGRVKTLHPGIAAGVLADSRNPDHRAQLADAGIEPFELVVVNLYRFAEAAARPGIALDDLTEEIDIGGPTLIRAAAKNHANVGVVADPDDYEDVVAELRDSGSLSDETRRDLALGAFRLTVAYDTAIAAVLTRRFGAGGRQGRAVALVPSSELSGGAWPDELEVHLRRVSTLRYGENPHQSAALYTRADASPRSGPFAMGAAPLQGKELSYNNVLDASAAAALARDLRGAAAVVIKHGNPCGAAEAPDLQEAWKLALEGDAVSAFGGVVAIRGSVDLALAEALLSIFLELVVAADYEAAALAAFARKPKLRVLRDASILLPAVVGVELRTAGGGVLTNASDSLADDPGTWRVVTARSPTDAERRDLDLAWRVARRVSSNAIVLARDRAVVGVGAGQMSRVDSARLAVDKAGPERSSGSVCASDAFFPFPDGLELCAAAGVSAFVQPGGSQRDADVIAAANRAGAAMLFTGVRHFRH